ncbi:hypothetical protein [Arthrobacter sp. A2-55]|uniref:hypothetical protein n=1 Tax=Arthrobacter sp. A2-55 TaxID=2897337 RepID=UPI0021CDABCB|nr:hypothetical protein [Arthrobacter sp. A2-55]MCU6480180.1 hypothetical protein [Arthrobacter sp. A2-55]
MTTSFNALHPRIGDGTFTHKVQTPSPVALGRPAPVNRRLRDGADALIAQKLRTAAANELGDLQRRAEKQRVPDSLLPMTSPLTERVAEWDSLDAEGRRRLLKDAGLNNHAYLLDSLDFSSRRIALPRDVVVHLDEDDMATAFQANRLIEASKIPGAIALTSVDRGIAEYVIDHGGAAITLRLGERYSGFSAHAADDDYDGTGWMDRVDGFSIGDKFGDVNAARGVAEDFAGMHSHAILCQEMKASAFENHSDLFGVVDAEHRCAELKVDGVEYDLGLRDSDISISGVTVHQSMTDALLNHVAANSTGTDGKTFVADLADIMRKARERVAALNAH